MSKSASSLTFIQISNFLKFDLRIIRQIGRRKIYCTPIGKMYYRGSKNYGYSNKNWWYSIDPDIVIKESIDYLCLAADYIGFFLIPSELFNEYRTRNTIGSVKGGREDFTIIKDGTKFIRRESKCNDWDISQYFIPYKHNEINNRNNNI